MDIRLVASLSIYSFKVWGSSASVQWTLNKVPLLLILFSIRYLTNISSSKAKIERIKQLHAVFLYIGKNSITSQ